MPIQIDIPTEVITMIPLVPSSSWDMIPPGTFSVRDLYRLTLTGAQDATDDLEIPMSSFTSTVREGDPSYLSCVIPAGSEYLNGILARINGELVIEYGVELNTGDRNYIEIVRVDYETYQQERSWGIDQVIVTGHRTVTTGASKEWPVYGTSYLATDSSGKRRIRAIPDFFLRCGDVCQFDLDEMVVGAISYSVGGTQATMEVTEA